MKIITGVVLAIFSACAMAQIESRNVEIINNSNIPIKITYNLCTQIIPNEHMGEHGLVKENCTETAAMLGEKGKANKISLQADREDDDQKKQVIYTEVFVTGISSVFGKQTFASSRMQWSDKPAMSICSDSKSPWDAFIGPVGNTFILDNMGTKKVYCSIHQLSS